MNQKGFTTYIIITCIVALIGIGIYFVSNQLAVAPAVNPISTTTNATSTPIVPTSTPTPDVPKPVACTQDAKQCPDGSYVGRTGKNCAFAACPITKPIPVVDCKKDSDCSSAQYVCQEIQGTGTACSSTDVSCVPTYTIVKGECKLKVGGRCSSDSDCAAGNLCHTNICTSPIGKQCSGPSDMSCSAGYACTQGCGSPVVRPDEPAPTYTCQLNGYIRVCPICLAVDTLIDTPLGLIPVQQLQKGDPVWTTNAIGERVTKTISIIGKTPVPSTHQIVRLVLADARTVLVSPGHPTTDSREVGVLEVGDQYDNARIVAADRVSYNGGFTYDILPSGETGFYWANGILLDSTLH